MVGRTRTRRYLHGFSLVNSGLPLYTQGVGVGDGVDVGREVAGARCVACFGTGVCFGAAAKTVVAHMMASASAVFIDEGASAQRIAAST
jgi:hypothetical protein